ncbi:MAG: O-antigen ligase family protein [Pseudomonadota bacterium]|nr:O-antigen ligase family protein [Pseudomonadota bacterium]
MSSMTRFNKLLGSTENILLFPLLFSPFAWILGLNLFFYHAVALYVFVRVYSQKEPKHIPLLLVFLCLYSLVYLLSILLVVPDENFSRILASLYNWSYWIMGCMVVYSVVNSKGVIDFLSIYNGVYKIIVGLSVIALILFLGSNIFGELRVPSILGALLPLGGLPPLISDSFSLNLLGRDWFAGDSVPRMSLLAPYPTAFAITIIGLLYISLTKRVSWLLVLCSGFMIYMSLSRMVMVFYVLTLLFIVFLMFEASVRRVIFVLGLVLFLLVLPYATSYLLLVWDEFNSVRQASSDMRIFLYQHSIATAFEERAFWGMGVKSRGELLIPLGSHSTLVGAFYKTGFIGSIFFFSFYLLSIVYSLFSVMYARRDVAYIGALVLIFLVFSMFEDMDAPQLVSYMFFLCVGFLCRSVKFRLSQ